MASSIGQVEQLPTTEVPEKASRRRFSAAYKLDILRRAERNLSSILRHGDDGNY